MPESETTRIEAFSDGIFAIAITLLTIPIGVSSLYWLIFPALRRHE